MATIRAHIALPEKLVQEIDELVGPRGRSAFLTEVATAEVKRRRMLKFLARDEPAWKDEDHPDIAAIGSAAWVHDLRQERSPRMERLEEMFAEPPTLDETPSSEPQN